MLSLELRWGECTGMLLGGSAKEGSRKLGRRPTDTRRVPKGEVSCDGVSGAWERPEVREAMLPRSAGLLIIRLPGRWGEAAAAACSAAALSSALMPVAITSRSASICVGSSSSSPCLPPSFISAPQPPPCFPGDSSSSPPPMARASPRTLPPPWAMVRARMGEGAEARVLLKAGQLSLIASALRGMTRGGDGGIGAR